MKGVSALIASVLLIAFTVSVAMIIMGWFSTFAKSTTSNISSSATESIGCNNAAVSIEQIYVSGTSANIVVKNTGYLALNITGTIINNTGGTCQSNMTLLTRGNITSLPLTGCAGISATTCAGFSRAIVTSNCGGVSDIVTSTSYVSCS